MAYFLNLPRPEDGAVILVPTPDADYYCEIHKHIGYNGEYYNFNGVNYDIHFPIDWVFQQPTFYFDSDDDTIPFGPETCSNCFESGYHQGVFIGYCANCASLCNYERGNGMRGDGVEIEGDERKSIWNLYLQNVSLDEIGDRNLYIDYRYNLYHLHHPRDDSIDIGINEDNSGNLNQYNVEEDDNITITYDSIGYISSATEDDITIAFSSFVDNDHNFIDVDSFEYYSEDYSEDDYFVDVDSIS
jgi:hypothetical protein